MIKLEFLFWFEIQCQDFLVLYFFISLLMECRVSFFIVLFWVELFSVVRWLIFFRICMCSDNDIVVFLFLLSMIFFVDLLVFSLVFCVSVLFIW